MHQNWKFAEGSKIEDFYYTILNKLWRAEGSLRRFLFRGDLTFKKAEKSLNRVSQSM
jgi:hypothetical protein